MEQLRALRAELNKALQACASVAGIKEAGRAFENKYGMSIWGCISKDQETFGSLYNEHLSRELENAEWRETDREREENILSLIESCGMPDWYNLKAFIERRPKLLDRSDVMDALEERRSFLELPEEE